jgi:hypothetical protein
LSAARVEFNTPAASRRRVPRKAARAASKSSNADLIAPLMDAPLGHLACLLFDLLIEEFEVAGFLSSFSLTMPTTSRWRAIT